MEKNRNPKKIAKNTVYLYVRMLVILVISLYTSRLVLKELGITDYGIYNVIGGLITIFSFINNSMAQASQRFITIKIGEGDDESLRKIFSSCVYLHLFIALIIVALGETAGLWYVCKIAVIPPDRFKAALWIYQCSIIVACTTVITVPYNALIIAHERMSAFSYFSIFEAIMKLAIVGMLVILPSDKLISYGIMMALLSIFMRLLYGSYSRKKFPETRLTTQIDKHHLKLMGKFAGWSFWGSTAAAGYTQGLNMVLNFFFGPAVNAARGVAVTVQAVIRNFSNNFQVAVNPQITKAYAIHDIEYIHSLVYKASFFSFFLFYIVALPVFLEIDTLLSLWLTDVPEYTNIFIRILLLISSIDVLASPINVSIQATGEIKIFELTTSIIFLMIIPLAYLALTFYPFPQIVFYIFLLQTCIAMIARLIIVKRQVGLSFKKYFNKVILKISVIGLISCVIPVIIHTYIYGKILRLICVSISCLFFTSGSIYLLGLNSSEKKRIIHLIKQRVNK